jgi:hypothetical protein
LISEKRKKNIFREGTGQTQSVSDLHTSICPTGKSTAAGRALLKDVIPEPKALHPITPGIVIVTL